MPKLINKLPKYRKHSSGNAFVELGGRRHYLGRWKSPESKAEYRRVIAEWTTNGNQLLTSNNAPTVNEITLAFWTHAQSYYRLPDGSPSSELGNYRLSLRLLKELYGHTTAAEFGPIQLQALRLALIKSGIARVTINQRIGRIKRLFRWAVGQSLIPASVHHGLDAVDGLRCGRSDARETDPIKPVPDVWVDAVIPHLPGQLAACVELQRLTGMRSGEVLQMRGCDLETSGKLWIYRPATHKTAHRGHSKEIMLGPRAQEIIRPWLKMDTQAYLWSPQDVMAEVAAKRRALRKSPMAPWELKRKRVRNPKRSAGDRYHPLVYYHAIIQTIDRMNRGRPESEKIPHWHPHQLRHNAATRLRKEFGIEAARVVLGHRSAAITAVYAEIDHAKAAEIMLKVG